MHLLIPILIIFWQSKNWTPQRRGSFNAIHCIKLMLKCMVVNFEEFSLTHRAWSLMTNPWKKMVSLPISAYQTLFMWKKNSSMYWDAESLQFRVHEGQNESVCPEAKACNVILSHPVCFTICIWGCRRFSRSPTQLNVWPNYLHLGSFG